MVEFQFSGFVNKATSEHLKSGNRTWEFNDSYIEIKTTSYS